MKTILIILLRIWVRAQTTEMFSNPTTCLLILPSVQHPHPHPRPLRQQNARTCLATHHSLWLSRKRNLRSHNLHFPNLGRMRRMPMRDRYRSRPLAQHLLQKNYNPCLPLPLCAHIRHLYHPRIQVVSHQAAMYQFDHGNQPQGPFLVFLRKPFVRQLSRLLQNSITSLQ